MNEPKEIEIVEDLFVTDCFVVKGKLEGKRQRLSRVLEIYREPFLSIKNAVKINFSNGVSIKLPQILINIKNLVFAHEFVDLSGDSTWKVLSKERDLVRVGVETVGETKFKISGLIPKTVLNFPFTEKRFFVMEDVEVVPEPPFPEGVDERMFSKLSYIILQRENILSIFGMGG